MRFVHVCVGAFSCAAGFPYFSAPSDTLALRSTPPVAVARSHSGSSPVSPGSSVISPMIERGPQVVKSDRTQKKHSYFLGSSTQCMEFCKFLDHVNVGEVSPEEGAEGTSAGRGVCEQDEGPWSELPCSPVHRAGLAHIPSKSSGLTL